MKTLLITYTPRGKRSRTKQLADTFMEAMPDTEILDLVEDVPDLFGTENTAAYYTRNYAGKALDDNQKKSIAQMDRMTAQLKSADIVVIAFPMYNFSLPATVKAWFDSVMQKGETWDMGDSGYVGLLKGKKALILTTSGGVYEGDTAVYNHADPLAHAEFHFMGFEDIKSITAAGLNMTPEKEEEIIGKAKEEIKKIVNEWYE